MAVRPSARLAFSLVSRVGATVDIDSKEYVWLTTDSRPMLASIQFIKFPEDSGQKLSNIRKAIHTLHVLWNIKS